MVSRLTCHVSRHVSFACVNIYTYTFFLMKTIFVYFNKDIFDLDLKKKTQMKCDFSLDTFITASGLPFQVSG